MGFGAPVLSRVSSRRVGLHGVKSEPSVVTVTEFSADVWLTVSVTVTLTVYVPTSLYTCSVVTELEPFVFALSAEPSPQLMSIKTGVTALATSMSSRSDFAWNVAA